MNGGAGCPSDGCGTVFNLRPPARACESVVCPWTETVLYRFALSDAHPGHGDLIFDQAGNIYGTTSGGLDGTGAVFKLTHSGGGWTETILHHFTGGSDGASPDGGVIFDHAGNLWGTTSAGGTYDQQPACGVVFELAPSGSGWFENVIGTFNCGTFPPLDGAWPHAGLTMNQDGSFTGTTIAGGFNGACEYSGVVGCGTVFSVQQGPSYGFSFEPTQEFGLYGPWAPITFDSAWNAYSTTYAEGSSGAGNIFELQSGCSPLNCTYISLYDFTGFSDGGNPIGTVIQGGPNVFYGTTTAGGANRAGVVWMLEVQR